jgi:predicted nucleotidyltransferase
MRAEQQTSVAGMPDAMADPLAESVRRLCESLPAESIYLFGSRARGDATKDSDFDFLVVVNDSPLPRYKREQKAFRALCGMGIAKDVLVFTRREFEKGLAVTTSLPATVVREGKLLYGQ